MKIATPHSEADAQRLSKRTLLKPGEYDAHIREAIERPSRRGNELIEIAVLIPDDAGDERTFHDYLMDSTLGAAKLRHACEAVGALAKYEAGEVTAADFPGHAVRVRVGIEKKRGYPDRNVIEDYVPAGTVHSRAAR